MFSFLYVNLVYTISVNTTKRTLTVYKYSRWYKSYSVAIGKPSTPTPKGTYSIVNKAYEPGGPFGARWLGLSKPHYGIHGTNNPSSIGKEISNGCIRMYNEDIIELYNLIPIDTIVKIS